VHEANGFNFHPIREVAILFLGIFATMMPALDWLQGHAGEFGRATPGLFYWASGMLSSVLDNAPTYLSFLSAEIGLFAPADVVQAVRAALTQGLTDPAAVTGAHAAAVQGALAGLREFFAAELAAGTVTAEHIQIAQLLGVPAYSQFVVAISVGAVFFGACTYIGNGPNFMVKSIAEHQRAHVPDFLGYLFRFTLPCLAPVLAVVWWLFFRG
jgi:Na+/H+ antiporter NhaD/arsenite permease-like protein